MNVDYIIRAEEEEYQDKKEYKKQEEPQSYDIAFSHVNYGYKDGKEVLSDVSFSIPQGSTLGILGGTGSGKSTIMQLLNRLYELEKGQGDITLGGKNIREIPLEWIRKNVGMVLQEPFLYSRTIKENIAASVPEATFEEIRQAAKVACIDEAIRNFPDG